MTCRSLRVMPLVVVLDPNGFCVEDVLAPWCATCYDVCWCLEFSKVCVSHMSRCARAIVQGEEQHGVVHMSLKTLAHNSCSGEFVLCTPRRLPICGARWSASRVNLQRSL